MSLLETGRALGNNRVVIITGASSGIGLALAERSARGGFDVVAVGRRADRLAHLQYDVEGAMGRVLPLVLDITEPQAAQTIARAALNRFGRIDILVNNAGGVAVGPISEQRDAALHEQVDTHIVAPLAILREALPALVERGGQVFFVGSGVARIPVSGLGAYPAAKAAVRNFTRIVRNDLRAQGIAVTYIDPGAVATEFMTRVGFAGPPELLAAPPSRVARRIYEAFETRPRVVNGVPWQTTVVAIGEALPAVTDWILSRAPQLVVGGGNGAPPLPDLIEDTAPYTTLPDAIPPPPDEDVTPEAATPSPEAHDTAAHDTAAHDAAAHDAAGHDAAAHDAAVPYEDIATHDASTPYEDVAMRDAATPHEDLTAHDVPTPHEDLTEHDVPTPHEDLTAPGVTTPHEDLTAHDVAMPHEDLAAHDAATPHEDLAAHDVAMPHGDLATPHEDLAAHDAATPHEDVATHDVATSHEDVATNDVATPHDDVAAQDVATPHDDVVTHEDVAAHDFTAPHEGLATHDVATPHDVAASHEEIAADHPAPHVDIAEHDVAAPHDAALPHEDVATHEPATEHDEAASHDVAVSHDDTATHEEAVPYNVTEHDVAMHDAARHAADSAESPGHDVPIAEHDPPGHDVIADGTPDLAMPGEPAPPEPVIAETPVIDDSSPGAETKSAPPMTFWYDEPAPPPRASFAKRIGRFFGRRTDAPEPPQQETAREEHASLAPPEADTIVPAIPEVIEPGQPHPPEAAREPEPSPSPWTVPTPPPRESTSAAWDASVSGETQAIDPWQVPISTPHASASTSETSPVHEEPAIKFDEPIADTPITPPATAEPAVTFDPTPRADVKPAASSDEHDDYGVEHVSEEASDFERALSGVARRMRKLNLSHRFLARLLVRGDVLFTGDVALRWAGMPNKNERALTEEALHALADAGYLQRLPDERFRVVRTADE